MPPDGTAVQVTGCPAVLSISDGAQVTVRGSFVTAVIVEHVADLTEAPDVTVTVAVLTPAVL